MRSLILPHSSCACRTTSLSATSTSPSNWKTSVTSARSLKIEVAVGQGCLRSTSLHPCAVVVGDEDVGLTTDLLAGEDVAHGFGDGLFLLLGEAHNRGAGAAEPTRERAGFHTGGDHVIEHGDEFLAIRLVKFVVEQSAQQGVVAGGENGGDQCDAVQVFDRVPERNDQIGRAHV